MPLNKYLRPRLSTMVLHRPRLVDTLLNAIAGDTSDASDANAPFLEKLILVHGPAGYGKTTLIVDFACRTDMTCCWYFLDETDQDRTRFLQGLLMSLRTCFPQFGQALDLLVAHSITTNAQSPVSEHYFETLIDKLTLTMEKELTAKFVLIFSNYHIVNAHQGINRLAQHLLHHLPSHCLMIIESRAVPNLDFAPFLLRNELLVIGTSKLSFTAQEVYELAKLRGIEHIEQKDAEQLATGFDGWIAGILLGAYFGDIQFLSSRRGVLQQKEFTVEPISHKQLFNYVFTEVFKSASDLLLFLQDISLLSQIAPSFCNALLNISNAEERLAYIEQQGLFMNRGSDATTLTYLCHPVLRELLYRELREHNPAHCFALHRRAADLYRQQGNYTEAIAHAINAQEFRLAADLIVQASQHMLVQGYSETIAGWIDALPTEIVEDYPQLLLSRANIFLVQYQVNAVLPLLDKALKTIQAGEVQLPPTFQAEILIARSFAQFYKGEYQGAQTTCEKAISLLPEEERALRALAHQRLGVCMSAMGDCKNGIVQLQQALQLWGLHTLNRQTAFLYGQLAKSYNLLGNYALAEHHRTRALYCWEKLEDLEGKVNNLIGMGVIHLHRGNYHEAEFFLNQALTIARAQNFVREEAYALINLGELRQEQENYKQALSDTEMGLILARQYQDSYLTNYALCSLATTYLLMDDSLTAHLLLLEADVKELSSTKMSYEECFRELTSGTVLLYQQRHEEAITHLQAVEEITHKAGWKRRHLQVMVRLAACLLALRQSTSAAQISEKAIDLARQSEHEHLLQIELRRQPALMQMIQIVPSNEKTGYFVQKEQTAQNGRGRREKQKEWDIQVHKPELRTVALGLPTVLIDGKPITHWRMAKAMELYFLLLDSQHFIHKEQIITALWSDASEQVDQAFRSAIHHLRRTIGNDCVAHHSGVYGLNLTLLYGDRVWYDVALFQKLYTQGKDALITKDDEVAKQAFQEMVALYHGDYVESFYSDWCRLRRDELRRMHMEALTHLAHIFWQSERIEECLSRWHELLKIDGCREDAHYGIMRCYLRQGKRTLALRQYNHYEEILLEELSATPGPAIQRFYQRLVQDQ